MGNVPAGSVAHVGFVVQGEKLGVGLVDDVFMIVRNVDVMVQGKTLRVVNRERAGSPKRSTLTTFACSPASETMILGKDAHDDTSF
jgi:hypothetical protein